MESLFKNLNIFFIVGAACWLASMNLQLKGNELTHVVRDFDGGLRNKQEHGLEMLLCCLPDLVDSEHLLKQDGDGSFCSFLC